MATQRHPNITSPLQAFLRASLCGLAQVFFIPDPRTGLVFLLAIFWHNSVYGVGAMVGTVVATATAYLLGVPAEDTKAGKYGFNGVLLAIALLYFFGYEGEGQSVLWSFIVLGAGLSTIFAAAFAHLLAPVGLPFVSSPYVLTGWLLLALQWTFPAVHRDPATTHLSAALLPTAPPVGSTVSVESLWLGLFKGIGEVMFIDNAVSGALFLLGIFLTNRPGGLLVILGALVGVLVPAWLGVSEQTIGLGLLAFNPALTAMAIGAIFAEFSLLSTVYALLAALATLIAIPAVAALLGVIGLPTLTSPFVLTLYLFLAARKVGRRLRRNLPESVGGDAT